MGDGDCVDVLPLLVLWEIGKGIIKSFMNDGEDGFEV